MSMMLTMRVLLLLMVTMVMMLVMLMMAGNDETDIPTQGLPPLAMTGSVAVTKINLQSVSRV